MRFRLIFLRAQNRSNCRYTVLVGGIILIVLPPYLIICISIMHKIQFHLNRAFTVYSFMLFQLFNGHFVAAFYCFPVFTHTLPRYSQFLFNRHSTLF